MDPAIWVRIPVPELRAYPGFRALSSMEEHLPYTQRVAGSNPAGRKVAKRLQLHYAGQWRNRQTRRIQNPVSRADMRVQFPPGLLSSLSSSQVRTLDFHSRNTGSNPVGDACPLQYWIGAGFLFLMTIAI